MSADLHIHVRTKEITDDVLRAFFANTVGSKWSPLTALGENATTTDVVNAFDTARLQGAGFSDAYGIIAKTPDVWIGSVSWLKAALLEDREQFIPSVVNKIHDRIGDSGDCVVTKELIGEVAEYFDDDNDSQYDICDKASAIDFLNLHVGEKVFTVSW